MSHLTLVPELAAEEQPVVRFFVAGKPEPAGSKKPVPARRASFFPIVVRSVRELLSMVQIVDDNDKARSWKKLVANVALYEMAGISRMADVALGVRIEFVLARPGSVTRHYPFKRPDALKLARAVEDALTGVVWVDDAQICKEYIDKRYQSSPEDPQGVSITVWRLI
jgi:Holliday junction resolvase RusA-like endonuclease